MKTNSISLSLAVAFVLAAVILAGKLQAAVVAQTGFETNDTPVYPTAVNSLPYVNSDVSGTYPLYDRQNNGIREIRLAGTPFGTGQYLALQGVSGSGVRVMSYGLTPLTRISFDLYEPSGPTTTMRFGFGATNDINTANAYIAWRLANGALTVSSGENTSLVSGSLPTLQQDRLYVAHILLNRSGSDQTATTPTGSITITNGQAALLVYDTVTSTLIDAGRFAHTADPAKVPALFMFRCFTSDTNLIYIDNFARHNTLDFSTPTSGAVIHQTINQPTFTDNANGWGRAIWGVPESVPVPGYTYRIPGGFTCRTPNFLSSPLLTFAGYRLIHTNNGRLSLKHGNNPATANIILGPGTIGQDQGPGGTTNCPLAGTIQVVGNSTLAAGMGDGLRHLWLQSTLSGTGNFTVNMASNFVLYLSCDASGYSGNWIVNSNRVEVWSGTANPFGAGTISLTYNTNFVAFNTTNALTLANVFTGAGGLIKQGTNTVTLTAINAFTGETQIESGTLQINGSLAAGSAVSVGTNGTLAGTGTATGPVSVSGTVAPGTAGVGTLTLGSSLTFNASAVAVMELTNALASDLVQATGTIIYDGKLRVVRAPGATLANGTYTLFNATAYAGAFNEIEFVNWPADKRVSATNLTTTGSITLGDNAAPVAENITVGVAQGDAITLSIIGGKYPPADANGDALTVTGVGVPGSGSVSFTSTSVTYTADGAADTYNFTYTVSDAFGATDTKTITVIVSPVSHGANFLPGSPQVSGSNVKLEALGIPGASYRLEFTASLTPPVLWTPLTGSEATAAPNGALSFDYTHGSPFPGSGFFRTRYVSGP